MSTSFEPDTLPDMTQLRHEWSRLYGCKPPPRARREFLHLAIEWHHQAKHQGGLRRADRETVNALVEKVKQGSKPQLQVPRDNLLPGAILMREWNGQHYEAHVTEKGFLFRGKNWKSLSQIAREITGARWNGPAFFGLRSKRKVAPL